VAGNPINRVDPEGLVYVDAERWQKQIDIWNETIRNSWLPDFVKELLYTDIQSQLMSAMSCPGMVKIPGDMIAKDWITKNVVGKVFREFPSQYLDKTINEIRILAQKGDKAAKKAWKLLTSSRFAK
jgi:hypothetical protein